MLKGFFATLRRDPSRAFEALGWWLRGKRQRARNRLHIAEGEWGADYPRWIETIERKAPPPRVSAEAAGQILAVSADTAAASAAIATTAAPYVLLAAAGATLAPQALARFAEAIAKYPEADVIYADCDTRDADGGRRQPWFKPVWDADRFLAQDFLSQICLVRATTARAALPFATQHPAAFRYALLLAATEAGATPRHIAHILSHLAYPPEACTDPAAALAAVATHLQRAGHGASVRAGPFGTRQVVWPLPAAPDLPKISVIVPTRDRADLLARSTAGVLAATDYPALELIIVDNASRERRTQRLFEELTRDPRVRILRDGGDFNFSRLNNAAVASATGQFVCLLNSDIEVIEPGWLRAMLRQAIRPGVGAVGAKLLYADRTIQHAGVELGADGVPQHVHRFLSDEDAGPFAEAHIACRVTAVTAACLLVARETYCSVGGLDENFAINFNDADFCLRLKARGWRTIYEPAARLIHHESKTRHSRGHVGDPRHAAEERALFLTRWGSKQTPDAAPPSRWLAGAAPAA